jgi:type I restriction-modification system DNA methylase subunit
MQLYNWYEKNNKSEKSEISEEQIKPVVETYDESKQVKKKRGRKPKNN